MQRTRLNTLVTQATVQFRQWVFNPWRRLSVIVISLLLGNFFATAISATAGQAAKLDVTISAILVIFVETISWIYYRFAPRRRPTAQVRGQDNSAMEPPLILSDVDPTLPSSVDLRAVDLGAVDLGPVRSRSTLAESLNAFKLGMIYGLFVEAFKLGS
ncbi:MAG: DUF565 domain-containing protein [Cyanobacteria bacterium J06621_11]